MRRPFFIFAILLLAMISVDISAQTTDLKFFFSVDSASPLFIGPSVEAGVVLEEVHRVGVRIRLPGLGLESQLIAKAQSYYPLSQWITPWSVGIDVCYSGSLLFNNKHKLYYGGSIGVQFTETRNYWYDSQSPYHRSFRDWHLPIIAVAGYEKTIDDRRYYRLGALIGLAVGLAGTDDARSVGFSITQYQPNTYFFFAAQAIFGWNF